MLPWEFRRRLLLVPFLAWLLSGLLLIPASRKVLERPLREQDRKTLRAEAAILSAALRRDPGGDGATMVGLLFTTPPPGDRMVLLDSRDRILADTEKAPSLWPDDPRQVVAESEGWTEAAPTESRDLMAGPGGLGVRLAGDGPAGPLRLIWTRPDAGSGPLVDRGTGRLLLLWLAVGAVLGISGWVGGRRVDQTLAELRQSIVKMDRRAGDNRPANEDRVPGGLFDLAGALERARKRLEREIEECRAEGRQRELILKGMAEGLVAVDMRGRVVLMNPASARLFALPREIDPGVPLADKVASSELHSFIEDALSRHVDAVQELHLDGGRRILRVRASMLRGADRRPRGLIMVLADVTDVRRLEEIRKDFVDNVSHELKTPLTTLRGYVETLLDGAQEDAATRGSFLRTVQKNADRMHQIVEDLLNLSRIESQGARIERAPIRIGEIARRVTDDLRSQAESRRVRLVVDVGDPGVAFLGNGFMLEWALANLVDNAIKYGGTGKEVRVRAAKEEDQLVLEVIDQGPGIPAAHLGRLFERFYRVERGRSRELGGTGLGLAIVKHVAMAHGGEASVDSEPGRGSTFRIQIPWLQEPARDDPGSASSGREADAGRV